MKAAPVVKTYLGAKIMMLNRKLAALCALALLSLPLAGCVLASNGLDYNRPMMPATQMPAQAPAQ